MHWTPEEEEILAERRLDVTENPKIGTSQSADSFWNTVIANYAQLAYRKRNNEQITGKWAKMSRDIKVFIGVYNQLKRNWRSGTNDSDVIEAAHEEYRRRQGVPFTHYKA
ncbi:uncharacterized protein [Rutidosis leptorrhynchoides]|uniref:uncharacterized protein n=1 Tax=Rutidosis leptorrhynchoides TaxID=125765 RepID=UPI003A9A5E21